MTNRPSKGKADKVSVECPHCHAAQMESAFARSTLCRKCGQHFNLDRKSERSARKVETAPAPVPGDEPKSESIFTRLTGLLSKERIRKIQCYSCHARQEVSSSAKSSLCVKCGGYIDLRDFKISTVFSRAIQTQGTIEITSKGELTSTKTICGEAIIQGKMNGALHCSGDVFVKLKGRLLGAIEANRLIVEKRADMEFVRPVKVHIAEISGKVSARVIADSVTITKSGSLEGTVYAKAINVEKGGIFQGELVIGRQETTQGELLPTNGKVAEGGQASFAL